MEGRCTGQIRKTSKNNIFISETLTYQPEIHQLVTKPGTPTFAYSVISAIENHDPIDVVNFMEQLTTTLNKITRRQLLEKLGAINLEIPIGAEPAWYPEESYDES